MSNTCDVIVVGAGISGVAVAYYLKKAGVGRVTILERNDAGSGGTGKSAAIVRQHYSTDLMAKIALESVEIFSSLKAELEFDVGYAAAGYLFLVPRDGADVAKKCMEMQRQVGVDTQWIETAELASRYSWLNTEELVGGVYEPRGGFADPIRSVEGYLKNFEKLGGVYSRRTACRALLRDGAKVTGVLTDAGPIQAGAVVNAAGPWAAPLAASAGMPLKMRTVREQDTVWEARSGRPLPEMSVSAGFDAIYVRPLGQCRFVVGRGFPKPYEDVDPNNFKESADAEFIDDISMRFQHRFPPMAGARLVDSYASLYDVTPDWYPYIGPRANVPGYFDFSGGSGHGFKIAPALAKRLAQAIASGRADGELMRLSYDRVGSDRLFQQAYGGNRG